MSEVKVNKLSPRSGTTVTIGDSGDTINIVGTLQNNGSALTGDISSVVAGTGLSGGGTSGDVTLNVEAAQSGITSLGTLTALNVAGNATITTTDNSDTLKLVSTDADASIGPVLVLHRDSGSPADNDVIGELQFAADSDAASETNFALVKGTALDVSHGSESGQLDIQTRIAGTGRSRIKMNATETVVNEDSVNVDFRVEGDGDANTFFVDAGNDSVGIGTGTPGAQLHVVGSATTNQIKFENTDGGTASAPDLVLFRNSASPANNDALGRIHFRGKTDSGAENNYAYMYATSGTVANGSEDGNLLIGGLVNGADRSWLTLKEYEITVNEDSADIDFRVESNAQTHMLFVNAGNSRIGLQDSSPAYMLESGNSDTGKGWSLANENNVYKIRTRATANDTQTHIQFENTNGVVGSIKTNGTATQFNTSSDYRLKENVNYDFDATARLKQLKPARFNFIGDTDKTVDGFIAHEVSSIVPEAITGTKDAMETLENVVLNADGSLYKCNFTEEEWIKGKEKGNFAPDSTWSATFTRPEYQGIDQAKLVPLLVKTIQELEARITTLEG
jgi:hypothetical protein